ncbi:hypothetical protein AC791_17470 [Klebsiella sp. RIT-PI-d]|uniref:hypothetical protein n=1 Tax=Klebsiella sp. RIT-PI-d TaxID=1681196 RepID=UPI000675BEEA|nr:hypothetical protein [Klebsiella sp. RIT-PI-d]KNC06389.1 hypothetical protein AC791_17470 [Klebsiella sp. RIT-PI-d]
MPTMTELSGYLNIRQDEYRYLLLDPLKRITSWDPLHPARLNDATGRETLRRVLRPDLAWSPEHCPLLLCLASPGEFCDETLVQNSGEHARNERLAEKHYICGWLSSSLEPDAMAEWLAGLCRDIVTSTTVPVHEPLRLELLQATVDPAILSALLHPVSQWHLLSCTDALITLCGQNSDTERRLNWGAEQAQRNVREILRLLSAWHDVIPTLPAEAVRLATNAWTASGKTGLHHPGDRFYLALSILTQPVDITRHDSVKTRLQQAADNSALRFTQLMQSLPDETWQELRHLPPPLKGC